MSDTIPTGNYWPDLSMLPEGWHLSSLAWQPEQPSFAELRREDGHTVAATGICSSPRELIATAAFIARKQP